MRARRRDVVILGGGFAGAATAFHLSRRLRGSIALVEREKTPGAHASGRNASLLFQAVANPALRRVLAASRTAYRELGAEIGFRETGSLLLGSRDRLAAVREPDLVPSHWLDSREAVRRVPLLEGYRFEAALETPGDGVIDIWALLTHYLSGARARGVETFFNCRVHGISRGPGFRIDTSQGEFEADCLVNAAGAWASEIAGLAGLPGPELTAFKRHLFVLEGVEPIGSAWPFVWALEPEFYFRPESGGLLFSVCDEARSHSLAETVDPEIEGRLAELVTGCLPRFEEARIRSLWSCFRTKASDQRFVIGRHGEDESFVWVAGLGGHGMGSSWEVGRLAAEIVLGRTIPEASAFEPGRFAPAEALA